MPLTLNRGQVNRMRTSVQERARSSGSSMGRDAAVSDVHSHIERLLGGFRLSNQEHRDMRTSLRHVGERTIDRTKSGAKKKTSKAAAKKHGAVMTGKKGGKYVVTSSGKKVYLGKGHA